jgi:hypothetical protein
LAHKKGGACQALFLETFDIAENRYNGSAGEGRAAFTVEHLPPDWHAVALLVARQAAAITDDFRDVLSREVPIIPLGDCRKAGRRIALLLGGRRATLAVKAMAPGAVILEKLLPSD